MVAAAEFRAAAASKQLDAVTGHVISELQVMHDPPQVW